MELLGTSYGLVWLSGFNPYAALLALAVAARVSNAFPLNPDLAFLTQNGFLFLLIALVILDFFAEKIPFVDQIWNALHTILRPLASMLIMHALHASSPPLEHVALLVSAFLITTMVHSTKWVLRLLVTIGCAAPLISVAENIVTVMLIFLSFLDPMVMLIFVAIFLLIFLYFLPPILSGLRYQWRVTRSLCAWIFGKRTRLESFNLMLNLSEREKKHLQAEVPPFVPIQAGVRVLWQRRLGKHWLKWWWGNRRVATFTWLLLADKALILLPDVRQKALVIIPFDQIQSIEAKRGIVKGSLKITVIGSQQVQVYECAVLRPEWSAVETLVKPFQPRQGGPLPARSLYPLLRRS